MKNLTLEEMHPNRVHIHTPAHLGERIADGVVGGMGSWRFIIIQTVIVALWIALNAFLLTRPFDVYPFVLLNLVFSTQAAYASPLILMASNRQSAKDTVRDDLEAREVEELFENHKLLLQVNHEQVEFFLALFAHLGLELPPGLKEHYQALLLEKRPAGSAQEPSTLVRAHRRRLTTKKLELSEEQKNELAGEAIGVLGTAIRQQVGKLS